MVTNIATFLAVPSFSPLEILLNIIVSKYLITSYCLTFVSEVKFNFQVSVSFSNIVINETHNNLMAQMLDLAEIGCSDYIVRVKDPAIFMDAFKKVNQMANARRSDKVLVFLPHNEEESSKKALLNVLTMKESSYVANLLIIVPSFTSATGCASYELVTHTFIGPDSESHKPMHLDKWESCSEKMERNAKLFPHDLSNMNGKTVKVACFTYKPYVILYIDSSTALLNRDGTEIRIMEHFCSWINCTIEVVRTDKEQWGEVYENRTGIGVLGNVVEDRADFGISALYSWYEEFLYMDFSSASIRTAIACIAPAPRLLISWEMPLIPFSWNMWIGMVLTFIISGMALVLAQGGSSDKAFLTTFRIFTAQSHDDSTVSWRRRSVTAWLILAALILGNAYGAGLASTFTVPKFEKPIDTIDDILEANMVWGATHDAWVFSLTLSQEPRIQQLVKQFRIYDFEELKRKSFTRSMAFSLEKLPSGSFAIGEYITKEAVRDYMLMKEDFYYEQNVVMLRKSSSYTRKISDFIGRLHESGLMLAWETQVALNHLDYKVQLEVKLSRSKKDVEIVPISFEHIVGIFYMYVLGIALSIGMFVVEVLCKREKKEQLPKPKIIRLYAK